MTLEDNIREELKKVFGKISDTELESRVQSMLLHREQDTN